MCNSALGLQDLPYDRIKSIGLRRFGGPLGSQLALQILGMKLTLIRTLLADWNALKREIGQILRLIV